jgi:hypothetical protein
MRIHDEHMTPDYAPDKGSEYHFQLFKQAIPASACQNAIASGMHLHERFALPQTQLAYPPRFFPARKCLALTAMMGNVPNTSMPPKNGTNMILAPAPSSPLPSPNTLPPRRVHFRQSRLPFP